MLESTRAANVADDESLISILRRFAFGRLPATFYLGLQLSAPLAAEAWRHGWYRAAGSFIGVTGFALWAVAQQHLVGHAEELSQGVALHTRAWKVIRWSSGLVAGLTALALIGDAFVRGLAVIFNCPGCAG